MRITLDTNVLVRGHRNASGPCRALLDHIAGSSHILVLSHSILYELEEVLRYPRVRRLTGLTEDQESEYVRYLTNLSELVDAGPPLPFATPDADDWIVLRTAIRGDADVLCSLDSHLRRAELEDVYTDAGIAIMTDIQLLHVLRNEKAGIQ